MLPDPADVDRAGLARALSLLAPQASPVPDDVSEAECVDVEREDAVYVYPVPPGTPVPQALADQLWLIGQLRERVAEMERDHRGALARLWTLRSGARKTLY